MATSLYERIGGDAALDAAVDLFYRKVLADPGINHFFDTTDMDEQRGKQKAFLSMVFGGPNDLPHPRWGLSVSRKVGGAVVRNRWKRLLREAFRLAREQLPVGVDLVVIPRPNAEPTLAGLLESLPRLAAKVATGGPPVPRPKASRPKLPGR